MSVFVEWKTVEGQQSMIWIVMTAVGVVDLPETRAKMLDLQQKLDYFSQNLTRTHKFTFLFDFSKCKDFSKMAMLEDLKDFLTKNDRLIKQSLHESYILLGNPLWKMFLKMVFAFRPPTRPHHMKMENRQLYHVVKYKGPLP